MRISSWARLLLVVVCGLLPSAARSQWTVTYLQPTGPADSFGRGVSGVDQVGQAFVGGAYHAARWTGSAASFVDLSPAGPVASRLTDTDGVNQVGAATFGFVEHSGIWSGTAASFADLHPLSSPLSSVANDTAGAMQTGSVNFSVSGPVHAARWSLTAASYIDIHPGGSYLNSEGLGTDGTSIAGDADTGGVTHAALWRFTPDLFIDLHPVGASYSVANDVDGAIQVGEADFAGTPHAALWSGSAGSFVDMNPPSAGGSRLRGVNGGFQVGDAFVGPGASYKAGVWTGTAASFVNLHSFLTPFTYTSSEAWGVMTTTTNVYVVGSAFNSGLARSEAILWSIAVPEPGSISAIAATGLCAMCLRRRRGDSVKRARV
jgi:hypothetical protein